MHPTTTIGTKLHQHAANCINLHQITPSCTKLHQVVVVLNGDTYYWVLVLRPYIASLLQSATAYFSTKCDGLLLQSAASVITKYDRAMYC